MSAKTVYLCDRCVAIDKVTNGHYVVAEVSREFDGVECSPKKIRVDLCESCLSSCLNVLVARMGHKEAEAWVAAEYRRKKEGSK